MRVETALELAEDIFRDFDSQLILNKVEKLIAALRQAATQPSEQNQIAVADLRGQVFDALEQSRFNDYPPSLELALDELKVRPWLGLALKSKIENALQGNDLTPAAAAEKLQKVYDRVREIWHQAEQFGISASHLNLFEDENSFNEYDFTIIIPRRFVNNELDDFGVELKRLDRIFSVFTEIATGSRENFKIKSISSTDLTVILESSPATALLIATALERLATFYEKILNIVVLQRQVFGTDRMPQEVKDGFEKHVDSEKKAGIELISDELEEQFFKDIDAGRRNELRTELRTTLTDIAKRYDVGFLFDVRGGEPPDPEKAIKEEKPKQVDLKRYQKIKSSRQVIRRFRAQSEPLLQLGKPIEGDGASENDAE